MNASQGLGWKRDHGVVNGPLCRDAVVSKRAAPMQRLETAVNEFGGLGRATRSFPCGCVLSRVPTTAKLRFLSSFIAALALSAAALADADSRVHPKVHRALRKQGTVNLIVTLAATTEAVVKSVHEAAFAIHTAKIDALKTRLQEQAKTAAAPIEALLRQEQDGLHAGFQMFWISNQVSIEAASFALVEKLAGLSSIGTIEEEDVVHLAFPYNSAFANTMTMSATASTRQTAELELTGYEWGVSKIGAPDVWADGNIGQGVLVGTIDGGVRWTHGTLKRNFVGAYGWYDPEIKSAEPYDTDGHGTHTMGTLAGSKGIGVAPGAKWMTCKGCRIDKCLQSEILACGQFMLCPTDTQGNNPDCSKAPRVVSNSWTGSPGKTYFKVVINAWLAAGIIPVFAQGNCGPECTTARSPGDLPTVIAVGASASWDEVAPYSSKGPSINGVLKPDLVAPGYAVRSTFFANDTSYEEDSGTGMSTPHVAGAVALLLSAKPELTVDQVKTALFATAQRTGLVASGYACGNMSGSVRPNNQWGYGRLDAFKAYESVLQLS